MVTKRLNSLLCGAGVLAVLVLAAGALQAAPPIAFMAAPSPEGSATMTSPGVYRLPASERTVITHVSASGVPAGPGGLTSGTVVVTFSVANNSKRTLIADPSVARIDDREGFEVLGASAFSGAQVFNEIVIPPGGRHFFRLEFPIYPPTSVAEIHHLRLVWPFEFGDQCYLSDFYFDGPAVSQEEATFRERQAPGSEPPVLQSGWLPAPGEGESYGLAPAEPAPIYLYPNHDWQIPIYPNYGYMWGWYPGFVTVPWALQGGRMSDQGDWFLARPPRLIAHPVFAAPTQLAPPHRR
jgi:hypothetical protein